MHDSPFERAATVAPQQRYGSPSSSLESASSTSSSGFFTTSDSACLVPDTGTLERLVEQLRSGAAADQAASAATLAHLCADQVNCFYSLKAGVAHGLAGLLDDFAPMTENCAFHSAKLGSALARNCPGADLAHCQLPRALVIFLRRTMHQAAVASARARETEARAQRDAAADSDDSSGDDDEPQQQPPPPELLLSQRVAVHLATALADLAFEQVGKRMIVQAGGVVPLLTMASSCPSDDCRSAALLALKRLSSDEPCAKVMLEGGARQQVDAMMKTGLSPEAKDCAASLLSSLEKQNMLSAAAAT